MLLGVNLGYHMAMILGRVAFFQLTTHGSNDNTTVSLHIATFTFDLVQGLPKLKRTYPLFGVCIAIYNRVHLY